MSNDEAERSAAQADLYRLLSACYYEPTAAFEQEKLFDSLAAAAAQLDAGLAAAAARLGQAFGAQDLQALKVDYTRLFLGPVEPLARPYGSFWISGGDSPLMQESTHDALEQYRLGGFDVDAAFLDLPDHVAVELEYLYVLGFRRLAALRREAHDEAAAIDGLQGQFLERHLGAWVGPFTAALQAGARTAFYRELAELTRRAVALQAAGAQRVRH